MRIFDSSYFKSIAHTMSCCHKSSLELQMCINSQLKIVPNKFTIYSCLSNISLKTTVPSCLKYVLKMKLYYSHPLKKKIITFSRNECTWGWMPQTGKGRQKCFEKLKNHSILVLVFYGICWQWQKYRISPPCILEHLAHCHINVW